MVELAIIMPLLVVLVFGLTEVGRALYHQQTLTKATATGARFMARAHGVLDEDCIPQGDWETKMGQAQILVITAGSGDPIVPGLDKEDADEKVKIEAIDASTRLGVADPVCVITVSVQTTFQGLFGDRLVPFTNISMPILNTRAEEVYIGE